MHVAQAGREPAGCTGEDAAYVSGRKGALMDFQMEVALPEAPERIWAVMVDVPSIAACIPGCENVVEEARLEHYSVTFKQKIGPFKLEVPAKVMVESYEEPRFLRARADGVDKLTRTKLAAVFNVTLAPVEQGGCLFSISAELQVAGKLASLGYSLIRKKAEENFAEFERRIRAQLEAI